MLFLAANVSERDLIVNDDECNVPEINDYELPLVRDGLPLFHKQTPAQVL